MKPRIPLTLLAASMLAAPLLAQDPVCVPQFVDGVSAQYRWGTTLVIQNQDQTQARVRLHFYAPDGTPLDGVQLRERMGRGPQATVGPGGMYETPPMNGFAFRSYRSNGAGPVRTGYVCVESQNRVGVHAMIHLQDANGNPIADTGVIPGQAFRRGGFLADQTAGNAMGIAFMNPNAANPVTCTVELFEENGDAPIGVTEVTLGPHAQIARLLFELFPELLTGEVGYVRFTCDGAVCPLALRLRGLEMLQIPVLVEEAP